VAYPTSAEYSEQPFVAPGVSDTGLTLRAFLPFSSARLRENVWNYTGKAYVLDSWVMCQQPILYNETMAYNSNALTINGSLLALVNTPQLMNAMSPNANGNYGLANFSCIARVDMGYPNEWPITLCQLSGGSDSEEFTSDTGNEYERFTGGLVVTI